MVQDSVWDEVPHWRCWEGFCLVAQVTAFNILCHIATNPWPPEVIGNKFCHFPSSGVANDWGVMVGPHSVVPKLVIKGDIHLSSVEY